MPDDAVRPQTCSCEKPLPVQKATRKGAARTYCARCGKPIPLRLALSR